MATETTTSGLVVFTTLGSVEQARSLVRQLVTDRLVACGTILANAVSTYTWKGKLEEEAESLVILKTRRECWSELVARVQELHPYDVPELIAMPIERGLPAYLRWIMEQTGDEVA